MKGKKVTVVDIHNHLPAADIAADRVYETLTELWLEDDHYKWRAMRLAGVEERLVTGDAEPWERFLKTTADLSTNQYNVLRILRGAEDLIEGL